MAEEKQSDKSGAPPCGLYMRINHDPDMAHWTPLIGAFVSAIKRCSGYAKNMYALEISLDQNFQREALEKAAAFVEVAKLSGLVSIVKGSVEAARDLGADGVIIDDAKALADARVLLGADAIIGLACGESLTALSEGLAAGVDYVTLGRAGGQMVSPVLLQQAMREKGDLIAAVLGPFSPDGVPFYVQGGASFIDGTYYIGSHDKGPLQATVNILHAISEACS